MSDDATGPLPLDLHFAALKAFLIQATGLTYYERRDGDLARRVERRLARLELAGWAPYLDVLRRSDEELDAIIAELTIGETYFFREPEQLRALVEIALPAVLERNAAVRRLRIWSAGCASGAEPYSVAVLLERELRHHLAGWEVSVLGTDINRQALARAAQGHFSPWELRGMDEELRCQCFEPEGKGWTLRPEYRAAVSFQYHNLVAHPFPSFATGLFGFDVILCRNVLIYFDAAVVARLVEQFRGALADGGWLLVGHAEPQTETFRSFRALLTAHATLYQKVPEGAPGPPPGPEREPLPPPQQQLRGEPAPVTHPPPATGAAPVAPPPPAMVPAPAVAPARSDGGLAVVRRLGDEGRLREALELCDELLGELGLEPAAHFHRALLLEQLGRDGEAEEALRKTLYLDRRFALAHFHRALLLQRRGARPAARRAFGDALRTLAGRRAGERLLATEPLTVADLRSMAATQLALLEAP